MEVAKQLLANNGNYFEQFIINYQAALFTFIERKDDTFNNVN